MDEVAFGRYRLQSLIGEGGMGKVYRAHDTKMQRDVAIKVLAEELATEPGYRERFQREAFAAARLTAPHVIPVYEADEIDGRLYLVMPVIEGKDVHTLLQRDGPMSASRAVHLITQLASAPHAAHAAGLIRRDIKPSNALVASDDFLLAITVGGLSASAVSAFTWSHHWVWLVPMIVYLVHRALTNSWWWVGVATLSALMGSWASSVPPDRTPRIGLLFAPTWVQWRPLENLNLIVYAGVLIVAGLVARFRSQLPNNVFDAKQQLGAVENAS